MYSGKYYFDDFNEKLNAYIYDKKTSELIISNPEIPEMENNFLKEI